ncbi:MAG: 4Fe-4S binding protein [Deltaproteobacteria bacterium]|nr:4Fe-4S binding protein [Deltaproteobacteria bacterium]
MGKVSLMFFKKDCMGCHACEVACKQEHALGVGPRLVRVIEKGCDFFPIYCHHCANAPCKEACPAGAIIRNPQGVVLIDSELCIGCQACVEACPFGAMQFEEEKGLAMKCDLCIDRLSQDERPACSLVCPTRCISFGDMHTFSERVAKRAMGEA